MKAIPNLWWNSSVFVHKLCQCSGWSRSVYCLAQSVQNTPTTCTGDLSGSSIHRSAGYGKETLFRGTNFKSHHSNILLTFLNYDLHTNGNTIFTQRTSGLHTLPKTALFKSFGAEGNLKELFCRNRLLSRGWSRSFRSDRNDDNREDEEKLEHRYMMERLASENDMLSRFRNTYIMTLVSLAAMQFEISQIPAAIGAVAIVTAELNLVVATLIYISYLLAFRRGGKLYGTSFSGRVLFAVAHFIFWSLLLTLLFPDGDLIDEQLKRYTGEK